MAAMLSQDSVNYREAEGSSKCGGCKFFSKGQCMYVEPPIDPEGLCDIFQPGAMMEESPMTGMEEMMNLNPESLV